MNQQTVGYNYYLYSDMRGMSCRNYYFLSYIILSMQALVNYVGYII